MTFAGEGGFRSFTTTADGVEPGAPHQVAPGRFDHVAKFGRATLNDDENKPVGFDEPHRYRPWRHAAPMAASIAAHVIVVGAIIFFAPAVSRPHGDWVLAYLVEIGDGHPGGGSAKSATGGATTIGAETGPVALPTPTAFRRSKARHLAHRSEVSPPPPRDMHTDEIASRSPASKLPQTDPAKAQSSVGTGDSDAIDRGKINSSGDDPRKSDNGGGGAGAGGGNGASNGDGSGGNSLAYADYGTNPAPMYPAAARRQEEQGTVTLRVLVGVDGQVERVEISESSGFDALDDSAVETVTKKWRFAPARRDGIAFESWVLVPIRFALTEANSRR